MMEQPIDLEFLRDVCGRIRDVAHQAVLPRFQKLTADQIHEKSPGNLVTDADIEAERLLSGHLTAMLPGSLIVGEESVSATPSLMDQLAVHDNPIWIIDPVDGTRNFAEGRPLFAMIVALMQGGKVTAGWLYYPTDDECLMGAAGGPLYRLDGNGLTSLPEAAQGTTAPTWQDHHVLVSPFGQNAAKRKHITTAMSLFHRQTGFGCAAQEYRLLLNHQADLGFYSSIWPWDHAAGSFLLSLNGGMVLDQDGRAYCPTARRPEWLAIGRTKAMAEYFYHFSRDLMDQIA